MGVVVYASESNVICTDSVDELNQEKKLVSDIMKRAGERKRKRDGARTWVDVR